MNRSFIFSFKYVRSFRPKMDPVFLIIIGLFIIFELMLRHEIFFDSGSYDIRKNGYYPIPHVFDSKIGYTYKSNIQCNLIRSDFNNRVIINEHGFHAPHWDTIPSLDVYRVIFLGASGLAANHVQVEETWTYLLSKRLLPVNGKQIEILNMGVDGYNLWNIKKLFNSKVFQYSPDAIVVWFAYEPYEPENYRKGTKTEKIFSCKNSSVLLDKVKKENASAGSVTPLLIEHLFVSRILCHWFNKDIVHKTFQFIQSTEFNIHRSQDLLQEMKNRCESEKVPFGIFFMYPKPKDNENPCPALGIPYVDDSALFKNYDDLLWPNDNHFDVEGNRLYAEKTAPVFQKLIEELLKAK